MATPFQVATVVSSPLYPNSIAWSEENLIAVAGDQIVTILNPDNPHGPRGAITLTAGNPFPVGIIDKKKDLVNGCLLSTCLSRDPRLSARSIAWSPAGFSSNGGCLLAVCTTDGRIKLYRQPYCEYQAEWIETLTESPTVAETNSLLRGCKRRGDKGLSSLEDIDLTNTATSVAEEIVFPGSNIRKASEVVGKTSARRECRKSGSNSFCVRVQKEKLKNHPTRFSCSVYNSRSICSVWSKEWESLYLEGSDTPQLFY
ncbi:hypothetical protein Droror1_Dr00022654 [Drosera rotundifolia]